MVKVAITGGIGSGKSYVCHKLKAKGVEVYDCDDAAKRLVATNENIKKELVRLVGKDVYQGGQFQKSILAKFLLASDDNKVAVNDIIHPAVAQDFLNSKYNWLESAILFDSGFYRRVPFGFVVCVSAPTEVRIKRVMLRDKISREKTWEWMSKQMQQEEIEAHSNFVIINDGSHDLDQQIEELLNIINKK